MIHENFFIFSFLSSPPRLHSPRKQRQRMVNALDYFSHHCTQQLSLWIFTFHSNIASEQKLIKHDWRARLRPIDSWFVRNFIRFDSSRIFSVWSTSLAFFSFARPRNNCSPHSIKCFSISIYTNIALTRIFPRTVGWWRWLLRHQKNIQ